MERASLVAGAVLVGVVSLLGSARGAAGQEAEGRVTSPVEDEAAGSGTTSPRLRPGTRVRVSAPGVSPRRLVGTLVESESGSLRLRLEGDGPETVIALASIERLETSGGWQRGSTAATLIGAGAGLAWGVASAVATLNRECDEYGFLGEMCDLEDAAAILGVPAGAAFGTFVGWGVGKLFFRTERWERVPTSRLTVLPRPDGAALAVSLRP